MQDAICVRVERPKSIGMVKTSDFSWVIQRPVIEEIQSYCDDWGDPKKIAKTIANSISLQDLKKRILEEEAKPTEAYSKPIVVKQKLTLSLPKRTREQLHVELRVVKPGVIEVHPRSIGHA